MVERGKPEWICQSPAEVEDLVVKLAKEGNSASRIGVILRDQYGIPSVKSITGKSVLQILAARGLKPELPEDLMNLIRKAVKLHAHVAENRKDQASKRALETIESRIHKLVRYYVRTGALPKGWRYEPERAAILVR
jgi:small subunit ribosomal protein S15